MECQIISILNHFFPKNLSILIKKYLVVLEYTELFKLKLLVHERLLCIDCRNNKLYVIIQNMEKIFPGTIFVDIYDLKSRNFTKLHRICLCTTYSLQANACIIYWGNNYVWICIKDQIEFIKYELSTNKVVLKIPYCLGNILTYAVNDDIIGIFVKLPQDAIYVSNCNNEIVQFCIFCTKTGNTLYNSNSHKLEFLYITSILKMICVNNSEFRAIHKSSETRTITHNNISIIFEPLINNGIEQIKSMASLDHSIVNSYDKYYVWCVDNFILVDHYDRNFLMNKLTETIYWDVSNTVLNKDEGTSCYSFYGQPHGPTFLQIYLRKF